MRRAMVSASRAHARAARARGFRSHLLALAAAFAVPAVLSGCGGKPAADHEDLGFVFDTTADSAALARGRPLLREFEPYRASDGALRVRGRMDLPDGARVQISARRADDGREVGREQVLLVRGGFDTPPMLSRGARTPGEFRFEVSVQFNRVWQPERVLSATRSGLALTGPGMRRGAHGEAIFSLTTLKRL